MNPTTIQLIAATLFAVAVIYTFSAKYFKHLAHVQPRHARIWPLLNAEKVEVVFVFGLRDFDTFKKL